MEKQYTELGDEILYKNANLDELGIGELKDYFYFAVNVYEDEGCVSFGDVIALSKKDLFFTDMEDKYVGISTAHCAGEVIGFSLS